jgi:dTDP-4-amino-4,6-dideoxygalactose transaminase
MPGGVEAIGNALGLHGIGFGRYFTPQLARQPFFQQTAVAGDLTVTNDIEGTIIALPMSDVLTADDVAHISQIVCQACCRTTRSTRQPVTDHAVTRMEKNG